jgi:uncharacterized membrane protein YGL010W
LWGILSNEAWHLLRFSIFAEQIFVSAKTIETMRSIESLLSEYGESHQNPTNKLVHWVCVPVIFFCVVGLLYSVKLGVDLTTGTPLNLAMVALLLTVLYYARLSPTLAVGMTFFALFCLWVCQLIEASGAKLWLVSLILFVLAWIGQFWGHKIEGKKPSFLKDVQFLLIGPAWLMSFIYEKVGIRV